MNASDLVSVDDRTTAFLPLPQNVIDALEALEQDRCLMDLMGPAMSQAYLAIRKHDAEQKRTLQSEVTEAYKRA